MLHLHMNDILKANNIEDDICVHTNITIFKYNKILYLTHRNKQ